MLIASNESMKRQATLLSIFVALFASQSVHAWQPFKDLERAVRHVGKQAETNLNNLGKDLERGAKHIGEQAETNLQNLGEDIENTANEVSGIAEGVIKLPFQATGALIEGVGDAGERLPGVLEKLPEDAWGFIVEDNKERVDEGLTTLRNAVYDIVTLGEYTRKKQREAAEREVRESEQFLTKSKLLYQHLVISPVVHFILEKYSQLHSQIDEYKELGQESLAIEGSFLENNGKIFSFDIEKYERNNGLNREVLIAKYESQIREISQRIDVCQLKGCVDQTLDELKLFKRTLLEVIEKNKGKDSKRRVFVNPLLKVSINMSRQRALQSRVESVTVPALMFECEKLSEETLDEGVFVANICQQIAEAGDFADILKLKKNSLNDVKEGYEE